MAVDKKTLLKFLDNPALVSAKDMELDESAPAELEPEMEMSPEGMMPEEMIEPDMEEMPEDEVAMGDDGMNELLTTLRDDLNEKHNVGAKAIVGGKELPSKNTEMLRKLKAGEPMDELQEEDEKEVAQDPRASVEMRKEAIKKIKQKYLGQ